MLSRASLWMLAAAALFCFSGCAKVGMPPGGDEDATGPEIISFSPPRDAVRVNPETIVELQFSEYVNRPSVESSLYLSPEPGQRLRYKWNDRTLRLIYLDPLQNDRTYVVSVGSQSKDLRGNPMGETFTLAFSTGDSIDRGRFRGWISEMETPQAVSIWAYDLSLDSFPDPKTDEAEYRLQLGESGDFQFDYLRVGRYRAFAITDRNFDGLWNLAGELMGLPPWDLTVTDTTNPWLSFELQSFDTTAIEIRRVRSVNSRRFNVRLSQSVDSLSGEFLSSESVRFPIVDAYPDTGNVASWIVHTKDSLSSGDFILFAHGTDNRAESWEDSIIFPHEAEADTSRPKFLNSMPSLSNPSIGPADSIFLEFDEPVDLSLAVQDTIWITSSSDTLNARLLKHSPRIVAAVADSTLTGGRYSLSFNGMWIEDAIGNSLADSVVKYEISVLPFDSLGSITGTIQTQTLSRFILSLFRARGHEFVADTLLTPGAFEIRNLPSGEYVYELTRDDNGDGLRNHGNALPFTFSEPFVIGADTLTVRARWDYEMSIMWTENP